MQLKHAHFIVEKKKKKSIKTNERIQYAFLEQCPVVQVQYKLIVRRLRNLREVI